MEQAYDMTSKICSSCRVLFSGLSRGTKDVPRALHDGRAGKNNSQFGEPSADVS